MARDMLLAPFIRALRKQGWKTRYNSVAGGGRTIELHMFFGQRDVEVQLHDDGLFRVTHMLYSDRAKKRGRMSTSPTLFNDLDGMWAAIRHEIARIDHPESTASSDGRFPKDAEFVVCRGCTGRDKELCKDKHRCKQTYSL